jgi:hypothetical protein
MTLKKATTKLVFLKFLCLVRYSFLKVHLHHSSKIKNHKKVRKKEYKSRFFFMFFILVDGSIRIRTNKLQIRIQEAQKHKDPEQWIFLQKTKTLYSIPLVPLPWNNYWHCCDNLPGIADDERPEDRSNTGSRASHSHSGGSGSDEFGGGVDVSVGSRGLESPGGHSLPLQPHDHSTAAGGHS